MHRVVTEYTAVDNASSSFIKVFIRARPVDDPTEAPSEFLQPDPDDERRIVIRDPEPGSQRRYGEVAFQFDKVFWTQTNQAEIFSHACVAQVEHVLAGYNSCCFAYGQTGSGKTYTMFGGDGEVRGIIPRAVEYLFSSLSKRSAAAEVAMVASFLEIYNDQIRDLGKAYLVALGVETSTSAALHEKTSDLFEHLAGKRNNPYFAPVFTRPRSGAYHGQGQPSQPPTAADGSRPGLKEVQDEYNAMNYEIREDNEGHVFVKDLSLIPVTTLEEVLALIHMGLKVRATHETKLNAVSSRSHTVFTIHVLQRDKLTGAAVSGMLNLVDLAGSERIKKSESQGIRLKEALHINSSLTALGKVIMALDQSGGATATGQGDAPHVPYRDSKLTRLLQNSLGGNSFTCVIAAVHPTPRYYEECLSTLQFANRCRNVRNQPRVNYIEDADDKDKRLKRLNEEVTALRNKLAAMAGSGGVGVVGGVGGAGGGAGGAGGLSLARVLQLLKTLQINASVSGDGMLLVNNRRYALDALGVSDTASIADISADGSSGGSGAAGGNKGNGVSSNTEKLQKTIKELKESNDVYANRAKERKTQIEEQSKELQRMAAELVKCKTVIKHKEFEYSTLLEEKERALTELRTQLESRHQQGMETLLSANQHALMTQQKESEKVPAAVMEYTRLVQTADKRRQNTEAPLRKEFNAHLHVVEAHRQEELATLRSQYEQWLVEKDKALSGFVDAFNAYREKKAEQLRMAEREIVRLYEYTEQLETILEDVERGKYKIKQRQGATGGKSTTGVVVALQQRNPQYAQLSPTQSQVLPLPLTASLLPPATATMSGTAPLTQGNVFQTFLRTEECESGAFGSVILPKGLKPVNPLRISSVKAGAALDLTKRIVAKHRERVAKLDKIKEDAFRKSLHYAAIPGATATGAVDDHLRQSVRQLLQVRSAQSPRTRLPEAVAPVSGGNFRGGLNTAPAKMQRFRDEEFPLPPLRDEGHEGHGEGQQGEEKKEEINLEQVLEALADNETFCYIQKLEKDIDALRKQLKEVTAQLQAAKVTNASLSRSLNKTKRLEDIVVN